MTPLSRCGLPARNNVRSLSGRALYLAIGLVFSPSPVMLADGRVVIISPHNEAIRHEFGPGFSEWHRQRHGEGVTVEWRDAGGTADAIRFVQSEFASRPGGIGIDIFFGGGSEPFLLLADKKLTSPYQAPDDVLAGIPQSFNGIEVYDAGYNWYGAALSSFGILQNTRVQRLVKLPFVSRWDELAAPELDGWVGIGDPRNSGTMNNMFEGFLQAHGWDRGWQLLTEIAGNARKFDRISSTTAKDVTLGETACAFAIDFFAFTQIAVAGRTNLTFALPQDFTAISPDGIAILKGAPNLALARRFIDFVLGEDGQRLWFLPRGHPQGPQQYSIERMTVRPDFYKRYHGVSNIEFSPFELKQSFRYNAKLARDRREVVAALAGALLVDTQTELRAAWRSVRERGLSAEDRQELGRMPLTESEAFQLATGTWKAPVVRNQKKIEWQNWAQRKYRRIVEGQTSSGEGQKRLKLKANASPLHEPYAQLVGNERSDRKGFMAPTHVRTLEVFAAHEPQKTSNIEHRTSNTERPMRRTIRCSAFDVGCSMFLMDNQARFMVLMRAENGVDPLPEPYPLTPSLSPSGGERVRRTGEGAV